MTIPFRKLVGNGNLVSWDSAGGTDWVQLATLVDADKVEGKWDTTNTTLQSELAKTFAKTEYDKGQLKLTIAYLPGGSEYESLLASYLDPTGVPNWKVEFNNIGSGSGGIEDVLGLGLIIALGKEFTKADFLHTEITIQLT